MRITRFIVLCVTALPCACLEMPIAHIEKTEGPVVSDDAGTDGSLDPIAACKACLAAPEDPGPGCQTPYTACTQDATCNAIINCGFKDGCFGGAQKGFLACGLPCVSKAGVLKPDDPVLVLASNLFQCFTNLGPCASACFTSD